MNANIVGATAPDGAHNHHPDSTRVAVPRTGRRLGQCAVVLGGSLAGLLSASVLVRHFAEIAANCEPIGEARTFRFPNSRWKHWEKMSDRPEQFLAIGDAYCSFNPIYG